MHLSRRGSAAVISALQIVRWFGIWSARCKTADAANPFPFILLLGPKLIFVTGLVNFVTAVARLVCPDLLGWCLSRSANIYFGPSILGGGSACRESFRVFTHRTCFMIKPASRLIYLLPKQVSKFVEYFPTSGSAAQY